MAGLHILRWRHRRLMLLLLHLHHGRRREMVRHRATSWRRSTAMQLMVSQVDGQSLDVLLGREVNRRDGRVRATAQ